MEVEVHRLGNINIIKDYIPHPNSVIDHNLFLLASQIECQIKGMTIPEKGPYISKLYGKLREEVYSDFEKSLNEYPENKRNAYIMKFYKNVDLKCQFLFEKEFNIREIYRQNVCAKETRRASLLIMNKENSCFPRCPDTAEVLLKKDLEELSLDWYLLIEKTVDILIKCQLYGVKKGCIYRDISNRIKQQWWQEEKLSWKERLASNWNLSLRPLKQVFKKKANTKGEKMPYAEAMDCSDILVLITWAACGEIVTKFFKQIRREEDNKELLANAKGFLLLVTQNLEPLLKQLEAQFEQCLEPLNIKDLNEKQKGLDDLINELVNFREQVCVFESGFLSERSMFSRNQSSHTQLGLGSDLTNSMRMDRNRTDIDGKAKNKGDLKVARSRSFHNPSMGFDFP